MPPYFTKRIDTIQGYINFHFHRIYTIAGVRYHVSCVDKSYNVYMFSMVELLGQWQFTLNSQFPKWIESLESAFQSAIAENVSQ